LALASAVSLVSGLRLGAIGRHGEGTRMSDASTDRSAGSLVHRVRRPVQKSVVSPLVRFAFRCGTASILDDDDTQERQRVLVRESLGRRLCLAASRAAGTDR
jgi:hypothetical protein